MSRNNALGLVRRLPLRRCLSLAASEGTPPAPPPLRPFLVEKYEGWFDGADSLSSSECQPLALAELIELANDEQRAQWEALSLGYPAFNTGSAFLREAVSAEYDALDADESVNICAPQEGIALCRAGTLESRHAWSGVWGWRLGTASGHGVRARCLGTASGRGVLPPR